LLDSYGRGVLDTAMRILGDAQMAQDVHQEVFLEIWRRWHTYNGQTKWSAYFYRTTVRKALELKKRTIREALHVSRRPPGHDEESPDHELRTAELQDCLARHLARLPKRQADVFVLSRIEGFAHDRIAEILGCSQNTVRVHLHRAMRRLARELGEYLND
jgi:RNA polymerase sigma-70 factor (ECF subfamily)